jgi:hypothetical protein
MNVIPIVLLLVTASGPGTFAPQGAAVTSLVKAAYQAPHQPPAAVQAQ